MRVFQRLTTALLTLTLLLLPAAASGSYEAQALHSLGLFQGTMEGRSDDESMALDRPATRLEGLVLFLRLLGRDADARGWTGDIPFADVPDWAKGYVGYALQNGLTDGVGNGRFGSEQHVSLNEYVTFLLRAAGYSETEGDFAWDSAARKGLELNLYDEAWMDSRPVALTRGDLAEVSYAALSLPLRDSPQNLAGVLVADGVVDDAVLRHFSIPILRAEPIVDLLLQSDLSEATDFTLTDLEGTQHTLSDYRGRTVFLHFWASWCPPCQNELPDIQAVYEAWAKNQGELVVLTVINPVVGDNASAQDTDPETIQAFLAERNLTFPVLADTTGDVLSSYGITSFPTTYMISPDGSVFGYLPGAGDRSVLDDIIRQTMTGLTGRQ